jgi:phosphate transport system permease protein
MASTVTTPPPMIGVKDAPEKLSLMGKLKKGDEVAYLVTFAASLTIILVTCLLVQHLWSDSAASRHLFGWKFLWTKTWDPVGEQFGALPFIYGTVVTALLALVMAVPVGFGAAIFLAELAPRKVSNVLTFMIELLAAVPSVIYGLLGIFVMLPLLRDYVVPVLQKVFGFLPIFQGTFYGVSFFSASCVLAIMIVPFIVSISREVLLAVPQAQREAMMALGATKWDVTWKSVVPYAQRGMIGSIFLALARALGETMAVTMVIGNVPQIKASLLAPGYTIAAVIANEFTEATGDTYVSALIELALVLFAVTMIINALARLMMLGMKSQEAAH